MQDHLNREQIVRYCNRQSLPEELELFDAHIAECADCRELLFSAARLREALRRAPSRDQGSPNYTPTSLSLQTTEEHLSYEQLEAFVDGKLRTDEQGAIQTHLLECQSCTEELADLRKFAADVSKGFQSHTPQRIIWSTLWKASSSWFTFRRSAFVGALASLILFAIMLERHTKKAPIPDAVGNPTPKMAVTSNPGATVSDPATMAAKSQLLITLDGKSKYPFPTLSDLSGVDTKIRATVIDSIKSDHSATLLALRDLADESGAVSRGVDRGESFRLLSPVGTFVLSSTPTFRWTSQAGVDGYTVHIYDSNLNPVRASPVVTRPEWKSDVALHSGNTYVWRVQTTKNGEAGTESIAKVPLARFRILDSSQRNLVAELRRSRPEGHLTIGILLGQGGVIDDAVKEFKAVPQSDPNYTSAQKFLKDLQNLRTPAR